MRNRLYGGVRGRKTKVGRKLSFSSYSIARLSGDTRLLYIALFPLIAARLPVPFYHLQWRTGSDCIPTFRSGMFSCAKVRRKNALQVPLSLPEVKFDVTFRNQRFRYS